MKQEVEEDYKEQNEKAKQEYVKNKDLQKIISQVEIILQKGFIGINSFNYSLYDIIYELRVDYPQLKELIINILTTFFFVNPKYNLSIEIMRVTFFFLLFSSESATYKFLKAYYSLLPSYLLDNDKVVGILTQKINSQFQNETYCQNNEYFKPEFLAEKYHKHIISFLVNFLRFETQITLIDNIFISKSFNRIEQIIFKILQSYLIQKMKQSNFDRYLLLTSSNTIFQNLPRSLSRQYTQEVETLITQVDEDDDEDGDDSVRSNQQKRKKKLSQSYYEQENQDLKKKLQEKNEQIKKLQEKVFSQAQQPRQQEMLIIKKMQTDMSLLQKKINDQKRFIEELTHKLIKQNKEKEEATSITKARDQLQNEIKDIYSQLKIQVNEEIQQQIKNNISSSFQNLTPNKSQDMGDYISTQPFERPNQQSHLLSAGAHNHHILKHSSFDIQPNKNKHESSFSTIYNSHSRQNSQYADLQFMNNILSDINQTSNQRQLQNLNGIQIDGINLNQMEDINENQENVDKNDNNALEQQQKQDKQTKVILSMCDVDNNQFNTSQNTKKSQNSNETFPEDNMIFDQSVIDRLDKLQGLLLKDQKMISQLFFSSTS